MTAAAALVAGAPALSAQTPAPRPTVFGVLAGLNSSTVSVEDSDDDDAGRRNGFGGGAYLTFGLTPLFGLRTELLYSMKGATAPGEDGDPELTVKLDYVELPILLQLEPATASPVRPRFYAGPAVAGRVRCRLSAEVDGEDFSTDCREPDGDNENLFKTVDFSGVVGGELAFGVGGRALAVGVRYTHGFTNISDVSGTTIRNRVIGFYGALELPFGR
jgi:hypothetical protein